jgi:hypothetical protein
MQTVLDSFCRCFGTPESIPRPEVGHDNHPTHSLNDSDHQQQQQQLQQQQQQQQYHPEDSIVDSSTSRSDVKRRTDRLELRDKQWDELFEKASCSRSSAVLETATASTAAMDNTSHHHHHDPIIKTTNTIDHDAAMEDLEYAQALAKVKLAANPSRHRSSHKRKRPSKSRDEIFRHRRFEDAHATTNSNSHHNTSHPKPKTNHTSPFHFLKGGVVANALCFATPIRDTDEEPVTTTVVLQDSVDNSDANTLNTCEDTITSTLYFDSKYAHVVQSQPPMPLFNQFKVDERHEDELRRIVASDSHNSLKMIRLMRSGSSQQQQEQERSNHDHVMKLMADDDSSDSDEETPTSTPERETRISKSSTSTTPPTRHHHPSSSSSNNRMDLDDPPPAVKAITNSSRSSSSRSNTAPLTPTSSSGQPSEKAAATTNERRFFVL